MVTTLSGIGGAPIGGTAIGGGYASKPSTAFAFPAFLLLENDGRTYLLTTGDVPMADFWLAKGDRLPVLYGQMVDANLDPINLTGGTVRFKAYSIADGSTVIDQPAAITDGTGGRVSYAWQAPDTAVKNELLARFEGTVATGEVIHTPNVGYVNVHIGN